MGEQVSQPDESKFNNMQIEAAAEGPEAEARRHEMNNWAENQGLLAEEAAANHAFTESEMNHLAQAGIKSHEEVKKDVSNTSAFIANRGVGRFDAKGSLTSVQAIAEGVRVAKGSPDNAMVFRSPAHINEPKRTEAPANSDKINL